MTTPIPSNIGQPADVTAWSKQVLEFLGWPTTDSNINALNGWVEYESGVTQGDPNFFTYRNPLSTTLPEPGSSAFNSAGVQKYPNWYESYQGTVSMLLQQNDTAIASAFKGGNANAQLPDALAKSQWAGISPAANQAYASSVAKVLNPSAEASAGGAASTNVTNSAPGSGGSFSWTELGKDLLFVLEIAGQFVGGVALFLIGLIFFLKPTVPVVNVKVGGFPELQWLLIGAGAVLIWSAIRVNNSICVIESVVTGSTKSCKLSRSGLGNPLSTPTLTGALGRIVNDVFP